MSYQKVQYVCLRCNLSLNNNRSNLVKHLHRKNPCKCNNFYFSQEHLIDLLNNNKYNDFYDEMINNKKCQCPDCLIILNRYNLKKHFKTCKKNVNNIKTNNNDEKQYNIINNITNNNTNNTNNGVINNIIINNIININNFGDEDISKIDFTKLEIFTNDIYSKFNIIDKINNYEYNISNILKQIINEPSNRNFKIKNYKKKELYVKINDVIQINSLEQVSNHLYTLITKIYNNYINNNKYYEEFKRFIEYSYEQKIEKSNKNIVKFYMKMMKKHKNYINKIILCQAETNKMNNINLM
jgi:hypothetical protein